jgi:uncharacterized protein YkwD
MPTSAPAGTRAMGTWVARPTAALAALAIGVALLLGLATAPPARAATAPTAPTTGPAMERQFVAKLNTARYRNGRRSLTTRTELTWVARSWARSMAAGNSLRHNPTLGRQVYGWHYLGENVGVGGDVTGLHQALMNSAPHRANILDRNYTQVGIGVAYGHGRTWVVQVFSRPW